MENNKSKKIKDNRGSAPIPDEAINRGDGLYDEQKANDKEYLQEKMQKNMASRPHKK